jgi:Zn-dependent M28 family amino/carboxypeptidase
VIIFRPWSLLQNQSNPIGFAPPVNQAFDPDRAFTHVEQQVSLGSRTPGSLAHKQVIEYISSQLVETGWQVELQKGEYNQQPLTNIIAKKSSDSPQIILAAHYDSRFWADQDENLSLREIPVLGANDGASGVAVLLELARVLSDETTQSVWLVFFDAEDQGRIPGWDWIQGSQYFADQMTFSPEAVVVVDMVGDADLQLPIEQTSTPALVEEIWTIAGEAGFSQYFLNSPGYAILDDHKPFLDRNIPAVDIIDFDYPYWHTSQDTLDKVSPHSLYVVGETLRLWLNQR